MQYSTQTTQEWNGASHVPLPRGNIDSGFVSEAPDDLALQRDLSVESLHGSSCSEERAGDVKEEQEAVVWDEARVSRVHGSRGR